MYIFVEIVIIWFFFGKKNVMKYIVLDGLLYKSLCEGVIFCNVEYV